MRTAARMLVVALLLFPRWIRAEYRTVKRGYVTWADAIERG